MWQVTSGDCQTLIQKLPDRTVSLILTDPPYFIDGMDNSWDHTQLADKSAVKPDATVGGMPAGMKYDPGQGKALYEYMQPVCVEWMRVIRPGGFCLVFTQPRLAHSMASAMEDAGWEIRDMIAWYHNQGQGKAFTQNHFVQRMDISDIEKQDIIADMGNRKTPQLKPQMELIVLGQAPREGTFVDNWISWRTGLINTVMPLVEPDGHPGNVIPVGKSRRRFGHLTPKPVLLLRHLIRVFCPAGGLVLDPFAGSGSTVVAARLEHCPCVGYEKDPNMAGIAQRRADKILTGEQHHPFTQEGLF